MRRLSGFSLSFQKLGFSLAKRENPASPVEAQEGRYQWFPPSDFLPFPKIIWCKPETGDRCEKGERQRIFSFVSFSNYSQCQIPCCYTGGFISAGAAQGELPARAREGPLGDDRDAQLVGLVATDGTCEFRCLISFILAGAVCNLQTNELRGTAMPRLRKFNRLCSRTVSDTANRLRKTRKKKSSAVPNFEAVAGLWSAPD